MSVKSRKYERGDHGNLHAITYNSLLPIIVNDTQLSSSLVRDLPRGPDVMVDWSSVLASLSAITNRQCAVILRYWLYQRTQVYCITLWHTFRASAYVASLQYYYKHLEVYIRDRL